MYQGGPVEYIINYNKRIVLNTIFSIIYLIKGDLRDTISIQNIIYILWNVG